MARRHARRVPPRCAALIFAPAHGDQLDVTLMPPAGKQGNGTPPEQMQLAIACLNFAAGLLSGDEEQSE